MLLPRRVAHLLRLLALAALLGYALPGRAQTPPTAEEIAGYAGLHAAVMHGDVSEIEQFVREGADLEERDGNGRTPLILAAFRRDAAAARALIAAGANLNALDNQSHDVLTIAAVLNDLDMLGLAIASGGNTRAITGPYGGSALIAAARLGHAEAVAALLAARAPVDHVDNLGHTALLEAIASGDASERYDATVEALIKGGASLSIADRQGLVPLALARQKGLGRVVELLQQAGAAP